MASLSNHPCKYNRRRTENTIYAQDYLKQWDKISKLKPVLDNSKMNTTAGSNLNETRNYMTAPVHQFKAAAKSTRRSNNTNKSTNLSESMTTSARLISGRNPMQTTMNLSSLINLTTETSQMTGNHFRSGNYMNATKASRSKQAIR